MQNWAISTADDMEYQLKQVFLHIKDFVSNCQILVMMKTVVMMKGNFSTRVHPLFAITGSIYRYLMENLCTFRYNTDMKQLIEHNMQQTSELLKIMSAHIYHDTTYSDFPGSTPSQN